MARKRDLRRAGDRQAAGRNRRMGLRPVCPKDALRRDVVHVSRRR